MALNVDLNKVTNANGQFLGSSSASPIAGEFLNDAFAQSVSQAKVTIDDVVPGRPCKLATLQDITAGIDADYGLNPNVFQISEAGDTTAPNGFILTSPTDVLLPGDSAPRPLKNQVINVALVGSGVTVYLPVSIASDPIAPGQPVMWDTTGSQDDYGIVGSSGLTSNTMRSVGNPINGRKFVINDDGSCSLVDCKVIKVKL